jgi:ABC-type multidrug transport system fused ATPase/permease subunit
MKINPMLTKYRRGIFLAFSFIIIEKTAWIIEPAVFGNVIDAMIGAVATPQKESPIIPLLIWIGIFAINSSVGTYRRSRSENIFLSIYNDLVANIARKMKRGSIGASRAASRAELTREVISFYQYRIPDLVEQGFDIGGAVVALTLFDWRLGATCASILVPMFFIGRLYNKKVALYQNKIHDQQEDVYNVYSTNDIDHVQSYYAEMAKWKQKIANWGAFNFGVLRLFLLGIFLVILFIAIDLDEFSTGNIYAIVAYVWTFVTSTEYLPEQLESMTSVKDISQRLQKEEK